MQHSEAELVEEHQQAAVELTVVDGRVARADMVLTPEKPARTGALWKENP